ncbi:MAG: hypothetical protein LWX07_03735, partial [Bacteroidetes bacterium]|nr:hypothetical protein [Bacteroidota bacterium]
MEKRVYTVYRKENFLNFLNGALLSIAVYLILLLALSVVESALHLTVTLRTVVFYTYVFSFSGFLIYGIADFIQKNSEKSFDPVVISSRIGNFFPSVRDRISNAISLYKHRDKNNYTSRALVTANLKKTSEETENVNLGEYINYKRTKNRIYLLLSVITVFLLLVFLTPLSDAMNRLAHFRNNFGKNTTAADTKEEEEDAFIKSFRITINYPAYTKLQPKQMEENAGDVVCIEGSVLNFTLTAAEDISEAGIDYNGGYLTLKVNGSNAEGSITAVKEGKYSFIIKDRDGRENKLRKTYSIRLLPDEPPKISIVFPGESEYNIYGKSEVDLRTIITDDFGFTKLTLYYRKTGMISSASNGYANINIPLSNPDAT